MGIGAMVRQPLAVSEAWALLLVPAIMLPAGLTLWALYRSSALTQKLHPLTPAQRRRKRKVLGWIAVVMVLTFALLAAFGGTALIVLLAVNAVGLLLDAFLTPWLHYRRAKRATNAPPR
jgi:hypothetical protein